MSTEETDPLLDTGASNPGYDEDGEQYEMENLNKYDTSSRRGSVDPTYQETSFGGDTTDTMSLVEKERLKVNFQNLIQLIHHSLLQ